MGTTSRPPKWIKPQLTRLVDEAPTGNEWLHEIKYDGYRMHARIDGDQKVPNIGAHTLFSIMTTEPNGVVEPIHEKPSLLGRRTQ